MAHIYRCSRCRTRNTFKHSLQWYRRKRKCRDCGYDRFYLDLERIHRVPCRCAGAYFWGPHRKGSALCDQHPEGEANRAVRAGEDEGAVAWLGLRLKSHTGDTTPF